MGKLGLAPVPAYLTEVEDSSVFKDSAAEGAAKSALDSALEKQGQSLAKQLQEAGERQKEVSQGVVEEAKNQTSELKKAVTSLAKQQSELQEALTQVLGKQVTLSEASIDMLAGKISEQIQGGSGDKTPSASGFSCATAAAGKRSGTPTPPDPTSAAAVEAEPGADPAAPAAAPSSNSSAVVASNLTPKSPRDSRKPKLSDEDALPFRTQVRELVGEMVKESASKSDASKSLNMLFLVLENLRKHPSQEKYSKVNTGSSRFKERFGSKGAASTLLETVGFEKRGSNYVYDVQESELITDARGNPAYLPIKEGKCPVYLATEGISECLHKIDEIWTAQHTE